MVTTIPVSSNSQSKLKVNKMDDDTHRRTRASSLPGCWQVAETLGVNNNLPISVQPASGLSPLGRGIHQRIGQSTPGKKVLLPLGFPVGHKSARSCQGSSRKVLCHSTTKQVRRREFA